MKTPRGHETCGIVTALGDGVTDFDIGDKVAVECFSHCGTCKYCETGQYNLCFRAWISPNMHAGSQNIRRRTIPDSLNYRNG